MATPIKYIHCALTHQVIGSRLLGYGANEWQWIAEAVASYLPCNADDVDCIDTDERLDNITVGGEIVAYTTIN